MDEEDKRRLESYGLAVVLIAVTVGLYYYFKGPRTMEKISGAIMVCFGIPILCLIFWLISGPTEFIMYTDSIEELWTTNVIFVIIGLYIVFVWKTEWFTNLTLPLRAKAAIFSGNPTTIYINSELSLSRLFNAKIHKPLCEWIDLFRKEQLKHAHILIARKYLGENFIEEGKLEEWGISNEEIDEYNYILRASTMLFNMRVRHLHKEQDASDGEEGHAIYSYGEYQEELDLDPY